jgi:A/G-specific adenine glycosylase
MLQQTQVATVLPYYSRWMARFPTVFDLAKASEDEVLAMWQGLGYYRRCRLLLAGARYVADLGRWPATAAEWLSVPGVGLYTAGAIASIAFGEPAPLVDGNVERVFARLTGSFSSGDGLKKEAWSWASSAVHQERPGDWNQALMELGATVCKPIGPLCPKCPIKDHCVAFRENLQTQLPVAAKKAKNVELTHVTWVPFCERRFGIRQIPRGEWWEGMWEFPRVACASRIAELEEMFPNVWVESLGSLRHTVTNHKIRLDVSLVRLDTPAASLKWLDIAELRDVAMPAPQRRALRLAAQALGA